jgi:hypothetical protein
MKSSRIPTLLAFCVYAIAPCFANAATCFGNPLVHLTGMFPGPLAVGDFNNDGNLDFVVAYQGTCGIGPGADLFLGDGKGGFRRMSIDQIGAGSYAMIAADLNGDGKLDLAMGLAGCGVGAGKLDVLLGNGDGTFQSAQGYHTGIEPSGVAAGDFNGDRKLDLIVDDGSTGRHYFFAGNGDGTFQLGKVIPVIQGLHYSANAIAADFNGDGKLDFAFIGFTEIVVELGNGDGTFGQFFVSDTGAGMSSIAVGDVNRDGKPDVVALYGLNTLGIFLGNGDGSLTLTSTYAALTERNLAIGDLNNDGIPDLVVSDLLTPPDFKIFKGKGDGTFPHEVSVPSGAGTDFVALGDFNHDGLLDVVSSNPTYTGNVRVQLNTGQCH